MDDVRENPTQPKEKKKPDWKISLVRQHPHGDQWARLANGWAHESGNGVNFTNQLLKMFGFKLIAQKTKPKE